MIEKRICKSLYNRNSLRFKRPRMNTYTFAAFEKVYIFAKRFMQNGLNKGERVTVYNQHLN